MELSVQRTDSQVRNANLDYQPVYTGFFLLISIPGEDSNHFKNKNGEKTNGISTWQVFVHIVDSEYYGPPQQVYPVLYRPYRRGKKSDKTNHSPARRRNTCVSNGQTSHRSTFCLNQLASPAVAGGGGNVRRGASTRLVQLFHSLTFICRQPLQRQRGAWRSLILQPLLSTSESDYIPYVFCAVLLILYFFSRSRYSQPLTAFEIVLSRVSRKICS